ncbi:ribonuclease inhibitor-like [Sphaeramia orbicularis]|uniref:ribonuclease inhibitor-like n=1 Tax=Sphaeramia orbicularis TaxID=375764 RepID=UPI0011812075|nr:ribonuclease inhibitor-like [Sphaeramia orbicularis]
MKNRPTQSSPTSKRQWSKPPTKLCENNQFDQTSQIWIYHFKQINNFIFLPFVLSRLSDCNLSERSCEALSSVLRSQSCSLTHLDLSNNDLKDSGVKILSDGLKSPGCRLDTLRLSGCLITEEGCSSLVSALKSNPSHLRQLDLSHNHPGDSGQELSALVEDPYWRLDTVRLEPAGVQMLKPGPRKYFCELTLDPNTAHKCLKLSENNKKVKRVKAVQSYPDHQGRFEYWSQLMCSTGLTGRCYWEVQWSGRVNISVTYRGIRRKGIDLDCVFGRNDQSWNLFCYGGGYSVWHENKHTPLPQSSSSSSGSVSVYVDCPAGSVSFYRVSSDKLIHLHTFKTTFTEPLFAGFGLYDPGSSVYLCDV